MKKIVSMALLAAVVSSSAWADTLSDIKKNAEKAFDANVEEVNKTQYDNLYEVLSTEIGAPLYTDAKASFFLAGMLIDGKTKEDLSEKAAKKIASMKFNTLPFEYALKRVNGNGEYKIVSFEDPNCGYCKRLYKELDSISNVTVYTFMVGILGGDSHEIINDVWCSRDRSKAWHDWMVEGKRPKKSATQCTYEHEKEVMSVARGYNLRGTPLVILGNGDVLKGFAKGEAIALLLKEE